MTPGAPLTLWRCPPFNAWISVSTCVALKRSVKVGPREPGGSENVAFELPTAGKFGSSGEFVGRFRGSG